MSQRLKKFCRSFENWRNIGWAWERHMEAITLKHNLAHNCDHSLLRGSYGMADYAHTGEKS